MDQIWFSPPEIVMYGLLPLNVRTIHKLIKSGTLSANNFAAKGKKRPCYFVHKDEIKRFIDQSVNKTLT